MSDRSLFADTLARISRPLILTRSGIFAERMARAFWPLWSVVVFALGLLMLGIRI